MQTDKGCRRVCVASLAVWLGLFGTAVLGGCAGSLLPALEQDDLADTGLPFEISFDVAPDGKTLVFVGQGRNGADLFLLDVNTFRVVQLTETTADEITPAFSPDGSRLAYTGGPAGKCQIAVRALHNAEESLVTPSDWRCRTASWSRDGETLFFVRSLTNRPYSMGGSVWTDDDLWQADGARTGKTVRLTTEGFYAAGAPCVDTHRKRLLFAADPRGSKGTGLFLRSLEAMAPGAPVALDDADARAKAGISMIGYDIDMSEDGGTVTLPAYSAGAWNVWVLRLDTLEYRQITHHQRALVSNPEFRPGTARILYLLDPKRDEHPELWEADMATGSTKRLAPFGLFEAPLRASGRTEPDRDEGSAAAARQ